MPPKLVINWKPGQRRDWIRRIEDAEDAALVLQIAEDARIVARLELKAKAREMKLRRERLVAEDERAVSRSRVPTVPRQSIPEQEENKEELAEQDEYIDQVLELSNRKEVVNGLIRNVVIEVNKFALVENRIHEMTKATIKEMNATAGVIKQIQFIFQSSKHERNINDVILLRAITPINTRNIEAALLRHYTHMIASDSLGIWLWTHLRITAASV
jgi:hypothetical protein